MISEKELRRLYWEEGLSLRQIAERLHCDHTTVLKYMSRYRIRRRPRPEANAMANQVHTTERSEGPSPPPPEAWGWVRSLAVMGDFHAPFEDERALEVTYRVLELVKPDLVVLNGDLLDCYALSPFDQDPARKRTLKEESEHLVRIGQALGDALPEESKLIVLSGPEDNHTQRIVKFLHRNEALYDWPGVQPKALLRVDDYGAEYYEGVLKVGKLVISHGEVVRKHSADAAQEMLQRRMTWGVMNHTHRLGIYFSTRAWKPPLWYAEAGCLCRLEADYVRNPDWQQGFILVGFDSEGYPYPEVVHIREGRTVVRGVEIKVS